MEKQERLDAIAQIFVDTMVESYKNYGAMQSMSDEEIENLVQENLAGVSNMGKIIAEKIDDKVYENNGLRLV